MLYLVEAHPSIEKGNAIDSGAGPGPVIAKIVERFKPKAIYGNPSRRQVFMVVDLDTPAKRPYCAPTPIIACSSRTKKPIVTTVSFSTR